MQCVSYDVITKQQHNNTTAQQGEERENEMKKSEIIETIKRAEAEAWLALAKYDLENKPVVTTWEQEKDYAENHPGHRTAVGAWHSLHMLMAELKIEEGFTELHSEAAYINHEIWLREQNAKGIYYDERGNRIA